MAHGNPGEAATRTVEELEAELAKLKNQLEVSEQRRKDTLSGYTKGQQKIKALNAEIEALRTVSSFEVKTTPELDQLMYDDPPAWRREMNKLEREAQMRYQKELDSRKAEIDRDFITQQRALILREFNETHPDLKITDELIQTEIPPRITKKLEDGADFEDVLTEIYDYMTKFRKIGDGQKTLDQPNMSKMGGSAYPSDVKKDDDDDYMM